MRDDYSTMVKITYDIVENGVTYGKGIVYTEEDDADKWFFHIIRHDKHVISYEVEHVR